MNKEILQVTEKLTQGEIVSFPTETVFALAVDPWNEQAVKALYEAKKRNHNKPLAVIVSDITMLEQIAELSNKARILFDVFCPGPLTLVLKKKKGVIADYVNPGFDTIAVRCPSGIISQDILKNWGKPLIATSANISGENPALSKSDIDAIFGDRVSIILEGSCSDGIASTIVDLTDKEIKILRVGSITEDEIKAVLNKDN